MSVSADLEEALLHFCLVCRLLVDLVVPLSEAKIRLFDLVDFSKFVIDFGVEEEVKVLLGSLLVSAILHLIS